MARLADALPWFIIELVAAVLILMPMDVHGAISIVACTAALALAILVWHRRSGNTLATLLTILLIDCFGWNFAELALRQTGTQQWRYVDRLFSTFLPAIMLHVVLRFIGKERAARRWIVAQYLAFLGLAVTQPRSLWWFYLFVLSCAATSVAVVLLWRHRAHHMSGRERERTELILVAIVVGTLLGVTDLWHNESFINAPPLANLGILAAMVLIWIAAQRSELLGSEIPAGLVAYSALAGALLLAAYLAAIRWLSHGMSVWGTFVVSAAVIGWAAWRDAKRGFGARRIESRRLALLGRLSDQLAHDIRNPLAALKGAVQVLLAERQTLDGNGSNSTLLKLMLEQVARLERTIGNYQRLAKAQPEFTLASLNDIVKQVVAMQRFGLSSSVTIRTELESDLPPACLDRDLLALALENLLRNASEAMPNGGVITVRTERVAEPTPAQLVHVQDDGQGMDVRTLERALDEFYTTKPEGAGLGLSFVKRVARAHTGRLHLKSSAGVGTVATLHLPVFQSR